MDESWEGDGGWRLGWVVRVVSTLGLASKIMTGMILGRCTRSETCSVFAPAKLGT